MKIFVFFWIGHWGINYLTFTIVYVCDTDGSLYDSESECNDLCDVVCEIDNSSVYNIYVTEDEDFAVLVDISDEDYAGCMPDMGYLENFDEDEEDCDEGEDVEGCTDAAAWNFDTDATLDDGSCIYAGDVNMNGEINILDIMMMITCIIQNPACSIEDESLGDPTGDGTMNILDIMTLINIIINGP